MHAKFNSIVFLLFGFNLYSFFKLYLANVLPCVVQVELCASRCFLINVCMLL